MKPEEPVRGAPPLASAPGWQTLALRWMAVAELRAQAGAWRTSLALLREMRQLFPEQGEAARRALADVFARSLEPAAQDKLSPLDLVALAEENADLLPSGPAGHALAVRLADRLMALDLPARAQVVLEKLADQAPPGIARATLGGTLAGLRLDQGAPEDALAALSASVVEGQLPPELLEQRTLVFARAAATGFFFLVTLPPCVLTWPPNVGVGGTGSSRCQASAQELR